MEGGSQGSAQLSAGGRQGRMDAEGGESPK